MKLSWKRKSGAKTEDMLIGESCFILMTGNEWAIQTQKVSDEGIKYVRNLVLCMKSII